MRRRGWYRCPHLLDTAELEALQRRTAGATRERMLRELAEAFEVITARTPAGVGARRFALE